MNYAVRYSRSFMDLSGVILYIASVSEQLAVYEHESDEEVSRTHIHFLLKGCSVTKQTLKNHLPKELNMTRSDYVHSTTYLDNKGDEHPIDDKFIIYMSKGRLDPVFLKGFTKEDCDSYKAQWKDYKNEKHPKGSMLHYVTVKQNPTEVRKRKSDLIMLMIKQCANDYSHENVRNAIKKVLIDANEIIGVYKVIDYYDTIMMRHNANRFDNMFDNIISRRTN